MKSTLLKIYRIIKYHFRDIPDEDRVDFNIQTILNGVFSVTYRGIKALKCPFDYVLYQMIICEMKPDLVIEIGTEAGGAALYIADLMNIIGHGTVHTIDVREQSADIVGTHPRIKLFTDGWDGYSLKEAEGFEKILVIDDGNHMYDDVLGALRKFSPISSYYIVEDAVVSEQGREKGFNGGPLRATREFVSTDKNFVVDRKYCNFFGKNATLNISGYLKRI